MTTKQFAQYVLRETNDLELKTGAGVKSLHEAMVAFSNTAGGTILIGVTDDREVVGRALDQGTDDVIREASILGRSVGRIDVEEWTVDGTPVIAVRVNEREDEVAQTSDGRVLQRQGGRSVPVFGQDLWSLIASRSLKRYELSDSGVPSASATREYADELAAVHGWGSGDTLPDRWRERHFSTSAGDLTVAGVLVLCDPDRVLDVAKFHIDLRSYELDETTSYVRREIISGPVHRQVEAATDWILRDVGTEMIVTGSRRHDVSRLPRRVVREVVANAVAHRDYSVDRTPVVVEVRPSTVVVRSPGTLLPPVTVATLREAQAPRNHVLIDVLRRFGLAEDSGQGIDVIQDGMRAELLDEPQFAEGSDYFAVTLPLGGVASAVERAWLAEHERQGTLRENERLVILTVMREGRITNSRAREVLGADSVTVRQRLQRLRDAGILIQHGERGRAYYTLGVLSPTTSIEVILLEAAKSGPLTNARARELTGATRKEAQSVLRRLVTEGRLTQIGERRGTRYELPSVGPR